MESRAVMPGDAADGDEPDLMRTAYRNLEDVCWWRSLGIDGVVLYSWGHPKYRRVARAIRDAGIKLVLNQDSSGLVSPLAGFLPWLREQMIVAGARNSPAGRLRACGKVAAGLTRGLAWVDPMRAKHLFAGDVIAAVTPVATERYRRICARYGGKLLAERVHFIPHPVATAFSYRGEAKERRVVMVGRWPDETQKRPQLLTKVISLILSADPDLIFDIVGNPGQTIPRWHAGLSHAEQLRVKMHGFVRSEELSLLMSRAMVSYCPSAYESFHIASAEALCCGATVVAGPSPALPAFGWFTRDGHGRLAVRDDPESHAEAVMTELSAWDAGSRHPHKSASIWQSRVHAPYVARLILSTVGIQTDHLGLACAE